MCVAAHGLETLFLRKIGTLPQVVKNYLIIMFFLAFCFLSLKPSANVVNIGGDLRDWSLCVFVVRSFLLCKQ